MNRNDTRILEQDGEFIPQVKLKLFWIIPTGLWRNIVDLKFDIVDGDFLDIATFKTREEAEEYLDGRIT